MFHELPIRMNMEDQFLFKTWPVTSKKSYENFKAEMQEKLNYKLSNGTKFDLSHAKRSK
jgi:hypothetical protein